VCGLKTTNYLAIGIGMQSFFVNLVQIYDLYIDVFAINESKIDNSVKDSEISIPGYNMIRKDRNRFGGGVVVYIREYMGWAPCGYAACG
jgi:hypothetical protein